MTWVFLALVLFVLYWLSSSTQRKHAAVTEKNNVRVHGNKITYTELAQKRHNIHTAQNLIKLGLVHIQSIDDKKLSYLYAGGSPAKCRRTHLLAHKYGLTPKSSHYVGD